MATTTLVTMPVSNVYLRCCNSLKLGNIAARPTVFACIFYLLTIFFLWPMHKIQKSRVSYLVPTSLQWQASVKHTIAASIATT